MNALRRWLEAWRLWRYEQANQITRRNTLWYVPLDQARIDHEEDRYLGSIDKGRGKR